MKVFSKKTKKILHIVFRSSFKSMNNNITDKKEFLQFSAYKFNKGKIISSHKHLLKKKIPKLIKIQESWVIISGSVKVFFYDTDNKFLCKKILKKGDASISFAGGHKLEVLENKTKIYEYKNGPYEGSNNDLQYF